MVENKKEYEISINIHAFKCLKCGHEWIPRVDIEQLKNGIKEENKPRICPKCKSAYWDRPKKNKKNKKQ